MPPPPATPRRVLVDEWGVIEGGEWDTWVRQGDTDLDILDRLGNTTRFRLANGRQVRSFSPEQRLDVEAGTPDKWRVKVGGQWWLKLFRFSKSGQGTVWAACPCRPDAQVGDLVALKSPRTAAGRKLLVEEIDILKKIAPDEAAGAAVHVADLVVANRATGTLATRLIDGESLAEQLRRLGSHRDAAGNTVNGLARLSVAEVVRIGRDIGRALAALHNTGHIHKDIKPGNVIVAPGGRAVLIDFGLVEDLYDAVVRGGGTPSYIAPEVLRGRKKATERADVFSLAATLYHLLVGHPPHFHRCVDYREATGPLARIDLDRFERVDSTGECDVDDLRVGVPRVLSDLVEQALRTDVGGRPTLTQFRKTLDVIGTALGAVRRVENGLWAAAGHLLRTYRAVYGDAAYDTSLWTNAAVIRKYLLDAADELPDLTAPAAGAGGWHGFPAVLAALPRAEKLRPRIEAMARHLEEYAKDHPNPTTVSADVKDQMRHLITRTLEGVRAAACAAVAAAHAWRTVAESYGA